jgi:hypothetical protein
LITKLAAQHSYLVPVNREVKLSAEVAVKIPAGGAPLKRLVQRKSPVKVDHEGKVDHQPS